MKKLDSEEKILWKKNVEKMWKKCGKNVNKCEKNVEKMWKKCGKNLGKKTMEKNYGKKLWKKTMEKNLY